MYKWHLKLMSCLLLTMIQHDCQHFIGCKCYVVLFLILTCFHFSRPATSFFFLSNPLKSCRYIIWRNYKWWIIGLLLLLLLVLLIVIALYSLPVSMTIDIHDVILGSVQLYVTRSWQKLGD